MSNFVPPESLVTDDNGHYLGFVYCSCTYDQWFTTEFDPHCILHSASDDEQRADIAHRARGIDVEQATQEALAL